uniref:Uncharacterized protein n=1 Tax=Acrobeloides nanus TaxID=290746 RepID=A0A914D2S5_9BILA
MHIDPTVAMRMWTRMTDIVAKPVGEAFLVIKCQSLQPLNIYWNHEVRGICYLNTPVQIENFTLFVIPGSNELTTEGEIIDCKERPKSIYRKEGKWDDIDGTVKVLSMAKQLELK